MTRKDYVLIAEALHTACWAIRDKEPSDQQRTLLDGVGYASDYLAERLGRDNPRFDRARFLRACGVQS